jgi:hypothetical protein
MHFIRLLIFMPLVPPFPAPPPPPAALPTADGLTVGQLGSSLTVRQHGPTGLPVLRKQGESAEPPGHKSTPNYVHCHPSTGRRVPRPERERYLLRPCLLKFMPLSKRKATEKWSLRRYVIICWLGNWGKTCESNMAASWQLSHFPTSIFSADSPAFFYSSQSTI